MKLLLTLLLLCFVGNAFSSQCFTANNPVDGFITNYKMVAYNLNSANTQQSYVESSQMCVDFYGQTSYNSLSIIDSNGQTNVELYSFGKNNTQYIIVNGNENTCYYSQYEFVPLQVTPLANSNTTSGGVPVSVFQVNNPSSDISMNLYVNQNTCGFISAELSNASKDGGAIITFTDYYTAIFGWNIPASCQNAQPITQRIAHKLNRSIKFM